MRTAAAVALILYASAKASAGFFDSALFHHPSFARVLVVVPAEEILAVIDSVFACDIEQFKELATEAPSLPRIEHASPSAVPLDHSPFPALWAAGHADRHRPCKDMAAGQKIRRHRS